jgi:alpha-beta hydrolase superfamily lysophospholipase
VLLLGLSAGGVLVANVAARNMSSGPVLITNSTFAAEAAPSPQPAVSLDKRSRIEQQLLQRVVQSPDAHLPRALVDPRTGLALNNLQAVCRSGSKGRYLCILRPSVHKPGEGLYVRYGPGGFTWGRYRRG